jgi:hypothetical protein
MENIKPQETEELEKSLLLEKIKSTYFKVYLWEEKSSNIHDDDNLKLVIIKKENKNLINDLIRKKGQSPRTKSNTIICLFPSELNQGNFTNLLKRKIAFDLVQKAPNLNLSADQKKQIKDELRNLESNLFEALRKYYKTVAIPNKDGYKEFDLGIPTYGDSKSLADEVYDKLVAEGEILEKIAPVVIKTKFLTNNDCVSTAAIYNSSLSTPGEMRVASKSVFESTISNGVQQGHFGLGDLINDKPVCNFFKQQAQIYLSSSEIIIKDKLCIEQKKKDAPEPPVEPEIPEVTQIGKSNEIPSETRDVLNQIDLNFKLPKGKVSALMGILSYLQSKYENIEFIIKATDGFISKQEFEEKIQEAFRQIGITVNNSTMK